VNTTSSGKEQGAATPSETQAQKTAVAGPTPPPARSEPPLSPVQQRVLTALSEDRQLSFSVLSSRAGASPEELRVALEALRARGLVSRLNTVVESYAARFPGLRVGD
jgi:hypothetical protein